MNEKLKEMKSEIVESLTEMPVKDLRKAVGITDGFHFMNEIYRGDENM